MTGDAGARPGKDRTLGAFFISMIPITLFLTIGGVLVLRPLTRRLGLLIEASARAKSGEGMPLHQIEQLHTQLETQALRIEHLEQKLAFTESLLEARSSRFLGGVSGGPREMT